MKISTDLNQFTVRQDNLHTENVIDGHSVLKSVWATRVFSYVTTDGAGFL